MPSLLQTTPLCHCNVQTSWSHHPHAFAQRFKNVFNHVQRLHCCPLWLSWLGPWCVVVGRIALAGTTILGSPVDCLDESLVCFGRDEIVLAFLYIRTWLGSSKSRFSPWYSQCITNCYHGVQVHELSWPEERQRPNGCQTASRQENKGLEEDTVCQRPSWCSSSWRSEGPFPLAAHDACTPEGHWHEYCEETFWLRRCGCEGVGHDLQ